MDRPAKPVIFFDGVCPVCAAFVDFVLKADRKELFLFAPLQGETARRLLPPLVDDPAGWSMLLLDENGLHGQSDAALLACRRLGGVWRVLSWALVLPRWLRDPAYRLIASHRYRWFGKRDACRAPSETEKNRFLP